MVVLKNAIRSQNLNTDLINANLVKQNVLIGMNVNKLFLQGKLILCQLWPYRLGKNPFRTKEISEEHKGQSLLRLLIKAREARKEKQ